MGFLGSLLGKNDTGIIFDITGISAVSVHVTLMYLSNLFKNNEIVCVTDNPEFLCLKGSNINIFGGTRMVEFIDPKYSPEPNMRKAPIQGVNLIDKEHFIQFAPKGFFDRIKKPVIFTDDVNTVRSSLQWSLIEKTSKEQADLYTYTIMRAYVNANKGTSTSNDFPDAFANFYIQIQRLQKFGGGDLEPPKFDIGQCIHYILEYSTYK